MNLGIKYLYRGFFYGRTFKYKDGFLFVYIKSKYSPDKMMIEWYELGRGLGEWE